MIYYFSSCNLAFVESFRSKIFLRIINLPLNVADKKSKAIFLADSSCRVSLLGRSCFYAPNPLVTMLEDIANKVVTFLS
jgi:hypothetical protein